MRRIRTFAFALLSLMTLAAAAQSGASPTIRFSLYAPEQKDSPVHIVGLEHDQSEIRFVLSNTSDKPVVAVITDSVEIVPRGCSEQPYTEPYRPVRDHSGSGFKVEIAPHAETIAARVGSLHKSTLYSGPPYPDLPKMLVKRAKSLRAASLGVAYMQVQFGVTGVFFKDGTAWPSQIAFMMRDDYLTSNPTPDQLVKAGAVSHPDPFDRSLMEADDRKCSDVAAVVSALESVKDIVFASESSDVSNRDDVAPTLPHLHFSCQLKGPKAVCRLPPKTQ